MRGLRILDDEGNLIILLGENTTASGGLVTFFDPFSTREVWIYGSRGDLVLRAGDGTYVCVWDGRIGVCEFDEEGFLDFTSR